MGIHISIATDENGNLSDTDKAVIAAINNAVNGGDTASAAAGLAERVAAANSGTKSSPAPTKKAAPAPKAETNQPAPAADAPTLDDAVALATQLLGAGKQSDIKEVLDELNTKRVSELSGDDITTFVERLAPLAA